MRRFFLAMMVTILATSGFALKADDFSTSEVSAVSISDGDWPWWRGPTRDGIAAAGQTPPTEWSATENVLWKTPLSGKGHASPIVVGDHVYLPTADEAQQTQSVLCFDRQSGKSEWSTVVHEGGLNDKGNKRTTQASSTLACDGERLFVNFLNQDAVYTTALSCDGEQLWQRKISDYVVHQGFGSSPLIAGPLVIVIADNKGGGALMGLDRESGKIVWQHERPEKPNYPSPILLTIDGNERLIQIGCDLVSCFDPLTGEKLWETEGATTECVTSTITDGKHVYTSGGYPRNHVSAVRVDGSGEVAWENSVRVYVPSMLVKDGYLYAVTDAGVAMCWKSDTGEEQWKGRLGGTFNASPVLVDDTIYATNEIGTTFLFKSSPDNFALIRENTIPGEVYASPVIVDSRIYMRIAEDHDGTRQEMLYCLGTH